MLQVAQCLVLLIFVVCVADLRRKRGMRPLVNKGLVVGVQLCAPIPIGLYGYVLLTFAHPLIPDVIALVLTAGGTLLVVKAKVELGRHHTWAGYYLEHAELCTQGIYAVIRHPLYWFRRECPAREAPRLKKCLLFGEHYNILLVGMRSNNFYRTGMNLKLSTMAF